MGAQPSTPIAPPTPVAPASSAVPVTNVSACPVKHDASAASSASACPVKHDAKAAPTKPSAPHSSSPSASGEPPSECPMHTNKKYQNPKVYNVYSQEIDPKNQMPATANQQPAPEQAIALPVERESSSIPKGGTDATWQYPSPQMFWNALVRKGKTEGASEEDMINVVRIHNNMNESTWMQVLAWEKLHPAPADVEGAEPKLLRFLGRPDELSPKARLKVLLGHTEPFDRHDWIVDRHGREVRYIIDYYHDEASADIDTAPAHMRDMHSIRSIKVDVRPAMDSPQAIFDRIVNMPLKRFLNETSYKPLPLLPPSETIVAEKRRKLQLEKAFLTIRETCQQEKELLQACKDQRTCENASIALQRCTAGVVCPSLAKDFDTAVRAAKIEQPQVEHAYSAMVKCLELFEMDARKTMSK